MKEFSYNTRKQNLEKLKTKEFDILIVGGGITGAGIARDASRRGLTVGLIEMSDFSSGTSSRSSKLVHGGLRYLENLEFGLVFEALSERAKLFSMAPHLVHPLRFVLPLYKGQRVGMFKMGLGMWLYDILSLFDAPEMHKKLSPRNVAKEVFGIKTKDLAGAYEYSDAYMDDDRLVHETLRSANESGAVSASYVKALGAEIVDKKIKSISCKDLESGETFNVIAKNYISSVGPWTDDFGDAVLDSWKNKMRPSKGIHITFKKEDFPIKKAVVMPSDNEKRIIFAIPRHEMVVVGTTDTDFKDNPSQVSSKKEDIDYVLQIIRDYFPSINVEEKDIIASYSGVRPLVKDGSASESSTSRDHVIWNELPNLTFVAGGKYTTYRNMAEEAVDYVLNRWPSKDKASLRHPHTDKPLNKNAVHRVFEEKERHIAEMLLQSKLKRQDLETLFLRHGLEAKEIIKLEKTMKPSAEALLWRLEALWSIKTAMCFHLLDFYLRRVPIFLSEEDHGLSYLDVIGEIFKVELGWSESQLETEKQSLKDYLSHEMGWRNAHS